MTEYVFRVRNRIWVTLVFLLALAYGIWFGVVLFGEDQGWTENPGAWAGLSTLTWAWIGIVLLLLATIYFLLLLTRREVAGRLYSLPRKPGEPESELPTFLTRPAAIEESPPPAESAEPPPAVIEEPPPAPKEPTG